jgi:signal transduction histidine kinase
MFQYLITAIVDLVLAWIAFSKKDNPAAKALSFLLFSLGAWLVELFLLTTLSDTYILSILFHVTRVGMFFIPFGFALLTWRLVGSRSKTFYRLFVIPGAIISIALWLSNIILFPSQLYPANGGYLPKIDLIYQIFIGYLVWSFIGSIVHVALSYRSSSNREKQRFRWLLITLLVSFSCGLAVLLLMPSGFYLSKFVGVITNVVFVSLLFYSTIQHNLMDIRLALSLGLTKAILLGLFVWLYFIVTSVVGDHTQSAGGVITLLAFVVLMLEAYPRLLRWILPNAKKILVKNSYEFRQVKQDMEKALDGSSSFTEMKSILDYLFSKIIRLNNYQIFLINPTTNYNLKVNSPPFSHMEEDNVLATYCNQAGQLYMADEAPEYVRDEMNKYNGALFFMTYVNEKPLALVALGAPLDVSYYRYDDIRIFDWLATKLDQVISRLVRLDSMQNQLGEAKKTLSMLNLMNHYHHDIKAPFAIIDGVLSNDIYDRDKQKDIVLAQVERGSRLIATMAGILGGKHQRRIQSCSLESLVRDCLYIFNLSFDRVDFNLAEIQYINGDAEDLKIMFINIIKNAIEARHPQRELILTVKSWMEASKIYLSIGDNGIGMSSERLSNIWDLGFSTKKRGSGIGMQAIQRIADEHNATIEVRSTDGVGSEFILCFDISQMVTHAGKHEPKDELAARRSSNLEDKRNTN